MTRGSTAWWLPVLTLIVGLGVGYLVWGGSGESGTLGAELEADDPEPGGDEPLPGGGATLDGSGSVDGLTQVLRSVQAPPPVRGDGILEGTVSDMEGAPIPGVQLRLEAVFDRGEFYPHKQSSDPEERLHEMVRGLIESDRWQRSYRQSTVSGADGSYRFENLADKRFRVHAELEGWRINIKNHKHWNGVKPGTTMDFAGQALARLEIEVVGGGDPDMLEVKLKDPSMNMTQHWYRKSPIIDVKPGNFEVTVKGGDHGELRGGPYDVVLTAGGEPAKLQVELEAKPVLQLEVKYAPDEAMELQVYTMRMSSGTLPTGAILKARGKRHMHYSHPMRGQSGQGYTQTFSDIEEGTYAVGVARGHNAPIIHVEKVEVLSGVVAHTLQVPPMDPDDYVVVRVLGTDGKVAANARISTGWFSENGSSSGGSTMAKRADGSLLVVHHDPNRGRSGDDRDKGTWWIEATVQGAGSKRVEYQKGRTRELEIRLETPGEVEVLLKGVAGTDYEGRVSVSLQEQTSGNRSHSSSAVLLDAKGKGTIKGVQPGEYNLVVTVQSGGRRRNSQVASLPMTVRGGGNKHVGEMPTLYSLTVRAAQGTAILSAMGPSGSKRGRMRMNSSQWAKPDKDGVVVFDALPAGTYMIRSGRKQATVSLPGPSEVTLEEIKRGG